ncbi:MAG: hypothetical protein WD052_05005 [Bacteroidales bacterium]
MRPQKSFVSLAKWLLRIALAIIVFSLYFDRISDLDFSSLIWYISVFMVLFTILLIVGVFVKKESLTVISGLVVAVLSVIMIFMGNVDLDAIVTHCAPLAIGFYFMARGNRG